MKDLHEVGKALAYAVERMDSFCSVLGTDVLVYNNRSRTGLPSRIPVKHIVRTQTELYPKHRHLYPEDLQRILDEALPLADPELDAVCDGFAKALLGRNRNRLRCH